MMQLQMLVPALGVAGRTQGHTHELWWIVLLLVVFALVTPLAYLLGSRGGKPTDQGGPVGHRRRVGQH